MFVASLLVIFIEFAAGSPMCLPSYYEATGNKSTTLSGSTCQDWSSQPTFVGPSNLCWNAGSNQGRRWCFPNGGTQQEDCDEQVCGALITQHIMADCTSEIWTLSTVMAINVDNFADKDVTTCEVVVVPANTRVTYVSDTFMDRLVQMVFVTSSVSSCSPMEGQYVYIQRVDGVTTDRSLCIVRQYESDNLFTTTCKYECYPKETSNRVLVEYHNFQPTTVSYTLCEVSY